jgi:hypothetical protein
MLRTETQSRPYQRLEILSPPPRSRSHLGLWRLGVVGIATLIIVGHGCHGGDHDDEPAVTSLEKRAPASP